MPASSRITGRGVFAVLGGFVGRPGLSRHPKFLRLSRALGNPLLARGALEFIWETVYESGDPRLGSPEEVEAAARWEGKGYPKGKLFDALKTAPEGFEAGFIQPSRGGGWEVHDLFHHAPEYVKSRQDKESLRSRRSEAGRKGAESRWGDMANERQSHSACMANDGTLAPAPAPAPAPALPPTPEPPQLELVHPPPPRRTAEDLIGLWNRLKAPEQPRVLDLGKVRRQHAEAALGRRQWSEWEKVFSIIAKSDLCRGKSDSKWVADFDFAIRAEGKARETASKALEGKYENRTAHRETDMESMLTSVSDMGAEDG